MRIIAGRWGGQRLTAVGKGDQGAHLRPTPDRVRESLFSALASRDLIAGARVLDLFAGTGALGLEALSRGAQSAVFVENGRTGQRLIRDNIARLGAAAETRVLKADATRLPPCDGPPCTLVFLDPPYGKDLGGRALAAAIAGGWLAQDAAIIWEEAAAQAATPECVIEDQRRYGTTHMTLMRYIGQDEMS